MTIVPLAFTQPPALMETAVATNPLDGLIPDHLYAVLEDNNLLSDKGVRDYQIRCRFRQLREREVPAYDAIESLRESYPYLQFDTIRKIVYKLNRR